MKKLVSYQLNQCKKAVIIYYSVILAILVLSNILAIITDSPNSVMVSNSTIILALVLGIAMFKPFFNFFQQNGISRNSQIKSYALFAIILALILTIFDYILMKGSMLFNANMNSNMMDIYVTYICETANLDKDVFVLVWHFVNNAIALSIGHFIALLYYRMSKLYRIIVSVTVPLVIISIISYLTRIGVLEKFVISTIEFIYVGNYFVNGVLPMMGVFAIIFFINKMLIKGAQVR